ncbi:MAG: hypothetical protein ABSH12_04000, partial [Endomicrobiales bacterium]
LPLLSRDGVDVSILPDWPKHTIVLASRNKSALKERLLELTYNLQIRNQPFHIIFTYDERTK